MSSGRNTSQGLPTFATGFIGSHGGNPFVEYLKTAYRLFERLQEEITEEIPKRLAQARASGIDPCQRGATWTYLTTDQLFDSPHARFCRRSGAPITAPPSPHP